MAVDSRSFAIITVIIAVIDVTSCEHFRGGSMSWKATDDGQVEISYQLAWKADTDEGYHNCTYARVADNALVEGDSGGIHYQGYSSPVHRLRYYCTARYESADYPTSLDRSWVMGENKLTLAPPPDGSRQFDLVYDSCCWVGNLVNYGAPRNWDFVMSVDLDPRADTGKINNPPITTGLPVQRVSKACRQAVLTIPTFDADGDNVRCRFVDADQNECRSNCRSSTVWPTPTWRLQNPRGQCKLVLRPSSAEVGWYAVALMIEDFSNGVALSKVPFQFMLEITGDQTCSKPKVVRPPGGTCWTVPVGETLTFNVTAETPTNETRISDIAITSIRGIQKSVLQQDPGNPLQYYITVTWTPTADDVGVSLFCFQPEDSNGLQGSQRCIDLSVGDEHPPVPDKFLSNPSEGGQFMVDSTALEVIFDTEVARPSQESEIRILLASDRSLVYSVKVETDPGDGVLFDYNAILFSIPDRLLLLGVTYTLDLPEGLARGYGSCEPWSKAASWDFHIGNASSALPRPPISLTGRFLPRPQCFGTFMQIYVPKTLVPYEDPTMMHFNEPTCIGSEHNGTHFVMGTQYQYCGTQIKTVSDQRKSIISNTIRIPSITVPGYRGVTRHNATHINVVCEMDNDRTTFVQFDADIPAVVYNRTSFGEFNFSLRMYPDGHFTSKTQYKYDDYPVEVWLDDRLYFEAKALIDSSLPLQIFLKSCEATPTPNPADRLYYRFIEDGCPLDDTLRFENQARLKSRFSIDSFAFLGHFMSDSIFVHCDIQVQENGSLRNCPSNNNLANKRRRRHANTASLSTAFFNTDGPIRIVNTKDSSVNFKVNAKESSANVKDKSNLSHSPLGSIYVSVSAITICILLVAALVSMVTVMRRLRVQNRRLGKFVGHPALSLKSVTEA